MLPDYLAGLVDPMRETSRAGKLGTQWFNDVVMMLYDK